MLDNKQFAPLLDLFPSVREMLLALYHSRFADCMQRLAELLVRARTRTLLRDAPQLPVRCSLACNSTCSWAHKRGSWSDSSGAALLSSFVSRTSHWTSAAWPMRLAAPYRASKTMSPPSSRKTAFKHGLTARTRCAGGACAARHGRLTVQHAAALRCCWRWHVQVLYARHADQRRAAFRRTLALSDAFARDVRLLALRVSMSKSGVFLQPSAAEGDRAAFADLVGMAAPGRGMGLGMAAGLGAGVGAGMGAGVGAMRAARRPGRHH